MKKAIAAVMAFSLAMPFCTASQVFAESSMGYRDVIVSADENADALNDNAADEAYELPECFKDIYASPDEYINKIKNGHENEEVPYNYVGIKEFYQGTSIEIWELAPKLSLDKLVLAANEAPGSTQKIRLNVSKLDEKYNELGVHIYYDTRLKVNEIVSPPKGASSEMKFHSSAVNPGEIYISAEGVCWCKAKNSGHDGAFAEISFTLPDDAEPGDLYPIGISYNDYTTDFLNDCYGLGIDMRHYIFSEGAENGYIKVTGDEVSTLRGDANLDNQVNIADAVLVTQVATNPDQYAQGKSDASITTQGEINADVDGKKGLTNSDAILIQEYKLGIIDKL